ncbi:MAG: PQQ-binding-like beta-propeller repeat protein [Pirellulales bacterium]|nr:PQQ-binding-like beta-propeller repeat protein [Pirellulales bacterium]
MSSLARWSFLALAAFALTAGSFCMAAQQASWPRFHGPKYDNISPDRGLLKEWPDGGPKLLWTAKGLGEGYSGVSVADGMIYTSGNLDGQSTIFALDMQGNIRWKKPNGRAWDGPEAGSYAGTRSTPTIDGPRVYDESPRGDLSCFDAKTGRRIWEMNILNQFRSRNIKWALAESVLIDGNHLICCPGGPETAVVALDKMTGKTVWKSPSADGDLAGYASPRLAEYKGLRMVLTMTQEALIGVNADSGDLLFRYLHPTKYKVNATMPLYHDGHIVISSGYATTGTEKLKLDVQGKKASVSKVWHCPKLDNHHGGIILLDGYLYGSAHEANRGRWMCVNWKSGQVEYSDRGVGKGSLTCADGMLYTMSEKRDVGLVEPTPTDHRLVSRFKLPSGGEGPTWAHPVVIGGRLYLRHGEFLYCYDVRGR